MSSVFLIYKDINNENEAFLSPLAFFVLKKTLYDQQNWKTNKFSNEISQPKGVSKRE